jgi:hypothetical protein
MTDEEIIKMPIGAIANADSYVKNVGNEQSSVSGFQVLREMGIYASIDLHMGEGHEGRQTSRRNRSLWAELY